MTIYYPMTQGYASKFDEARLFRSPADARQYDMFVAADALANLDNGLLLKLMRDDPSDANIASGDKLAKAAAFFGEAYEDNKARLRKAAEPPPEEPAADGPIDEEALPAPPRMVGADRGKMGEVVF